MTTTVRPLATVTLTLPRTTVRFSVLGRLGPRAATPMTFPRRTDSTTVNVAVIAQSEPDDTHVTGTSTTVPTPAAAPTDARGGPVSPVDPVDPVTPVEPVEPVAASAASDAPAVLGRCALSPPYAAVTLYPPTAAGVNET